MRIKPTITCSGIILIALSTAGALLGAADSKAPSETELLQRIQTLELKVAQLEQKAAAERAVNITSPIFITPQPEVLSGPPTILPGTTPPQFVPRQFNGTTFYLVPLGRASQ